MNTMVTVSCSVGGRASSPAPPRPPQPARAASCSAILVRQNSTRLRVLQRGHSKLSLGSGVGESVIKLGEAMEESFLNIEGGGGDSLVPQLNQASIVFDEKDKHLVLCTR